MSTAKDKLKTFILWYLSGNATNEIVIEGLHQTTRIRE